MTDLIFTAATTDIITSTAHGLLTGQLLTVFNVGGALPAATPALVYGTDYFFIRIDADTGKLATSSANAAAGTAIDITGTGTGVHHILVGLPAIRQRTYTAGSQVPSADLNAFQAQFPSGGKRSQWTRTFFPKFLVPSNFLAGTNPVNGALPVCYNSASAVTAAVFDIPFDAGDRLVGLKYWASGNGTVDLTAGSLLYTDSMIVAPTPNTTWVDNNRASGFALVDIAVIGTGPAFTPIVTIAGGSLQVQITTNAAGYSMGPWLAIFDRL